MRESNRIQVAR